MGEQRRSEHPYRIRRAGGDNQAMVAGSGWLELDHEQQMHRAVALAWTAPPALFRSIIVDRRTGDVLAEGANDCTTDHPLVHGETDAIESCFRRHPGVDWSALALYTTAEPCSMCQSAILWAGISVVVYGTSAPTLQRLGFATSGIRAEEIAARSELGPCTVIGGVLEAQCDEIFATWDDALPAWPPAGNPR